MFILLLSVIRRLEPKSIIKQKAENIFVPRHFANAMLAVGCS
jgi:hypothetical protein